MQTGASDSFQANIKTWAQFFFFGALKNFIPAGSSPAGSQASEESAERSPDPTPVSSLSSGTLACKLTASITGADVVTVAFLLLPPPWPPVINNSCFSPS